MFHQSRVCCKHITQRQMLLLTAKTLAFRISDTKQRKCHRMDGEMSDLYLIYIHDDAAFLRNETRNSSADEIPERDVLL